MASRSQADSAHDQNATLTNEIVWRDSAGAREFDTFRHKKLCAKAVFKGSTPEGRRALRMRPGLRSVLIVTNGVAAARHKAADYTDFFWITLIYFRGAAWYFGWRASSGEKISVTKMFCLPKVKRERRDQSVIGVFVGEARAATAGWKSRWRRSRRRNSIGLR